MSRVGSEWRSGHETTGIELSGGSDRVSASDRYSQHPVSLAATSFSSAPSGARDDEVEGFWLLMVNRSPAEWLATISNRKQLIGRSPDAVFRVPPQFRSVSRRHAEIWSDRQGVNLLDLGSTAGTRINDVYISAGTPARLHVGDRITLGDLLLILGDGGVPIRSGAEDLLGDVDQTSQDCLDEHSLLLRSRQEQLTPAENEIMLWISRGVLKDEAIANKTFRSPNTVRTHVSNLLRKLGLHSRVEVWGFLHRPA